VVRFNRFRILAATLILLPASLQSLSAADGAVAAPPPVSPSYIFVGFVGGFVRHDNPHHEPVVLARRIWQFSPKDAHVEVFENRRRKAAHRSIVRLVDNNHDGVLSNEEKRNARIMLFGHSWGASAVVMLARELNHDGIPVLLTVQVDSVAKLWQDDGIIPENVAQAVNFYQPHGFIHGRSQITAADDSKTQILGNYRFDYQQAPVKCEGVSWIDRTFMHNHIESDCDPQVWGQIENLIRQRMESNSTDAIAAIP